MGISIGVSSDGTNWILVIFSSPRQLATSEAKLAIFSSSGTLVFPPKAFSLLNYSTDRAAFFSTGNGTSVLVGDRLLISTASFPVGDQVQITGLTRILFTGTLR
ncbi:MAG: hypothetical protein E6K19_08975 [Methanobacteriota archaeon]|nr:MAG: hypothetical protein E6K19_08975 [Euryarchaeota archaeon]